MDLIIVAIAGISLLLIIGGFFVRRQSTSLILILLGIAGIAFSIVADSFERGVKFNGLYGEQIENQKIYTSYNQSED